MSLNDGLTIIAILLAPFIAVRVSEYLNQIKEAENRKLEVFRDLMATRAAGLSPKHVEALNRIEVKFFEKTPKKTKNILTAWKEYHDHLSQAPNIPLENTDAWNNWTSKKEDYLISLLFEMSSYFKYDFDKTQIKRGYYYPKGYIDIETDQTIIRKGLVKVFTDEKLFPVLTFTPSDIKPDQSAGQDLGKEKWEK